MEDKQTQDVETIIVRCNDKYGDACLSDSVNKSCSKDRKPEGYVEIYEKDENGKEKLVGKSNLVLFVGREWIASRICNQNNSNISADEDEFISWFGLGVGGAPIGDPLNPTTPVNTDTGLSSEIGIHATDTNLADYRAGYYYKHPFDSIEFQQDPLNDNSWLILKITTTISNEDANGHNLNEAGLFTSNSDAGEHTGPFNIFSIVTFPTIVKDDSRQLVFYWYLYC